MNFATDKKFLPGPSGFAAKAVSLSQLRDLKDKRTEERVHEYIVADGG